MPQTVGGGASGQTHLRQDQKFQYKKSNETMHLDREKGNALGKTTIEEHRAGARLELPIVDYQEGSWAVRSTQRYRRRR